MNKEWKQEDLDKFSEMYKDFLERCKHVVDVLNEIYTELTENKAPYCFEDFHINEYGDVEFSIYTSTHEKQDRVFPKRLLTIQWNFELRHEILKEMCKQLFENGTDAELVHVLKNAVKYKPCNPFESNKVEPKFKVGDWVTNSIETVQITGYDIDYGYQVDYKSNLQHRDTDIIEKEYHLWTIQDAKDGDVLVFDDIIMIFKSIKTACTANTYILYCDRIAVDDWCDFGHNAHPATKEQRDLLFNKMKDAGYEWDVEKKELKISDWSGNDEKTDIRDPEWSITMKGLDSAVPKAAFLSQFQRDCCTDGRFEMIERVKDYLKEATNIETDEDEMKTIDSILFRFWQMGWLEMIDEKIKEKNK